MPLLFISHKHSDRRIAEVLAQFIEERGGGKIKVHLSSSPDFEGPRFGPSINAQLRDALWKTEALILLYTSEEEDWSYCMWEVGMATLPQSPNTNLIVFQCGRDIPKLFQDVLRINPRSKDDIKKFTMQLLREPSLFPSGAILPDLKETYIENHAADLYSRLGGVLPQEPDGQAEQWPAWPHLRLELPRAQADRIAKAGEAESTVLARQIVSNDAEVVRYDPRAAQLFGRQSLPEKLKFRELFDAWKEKYPEGDPTWFESCCEQIKVCARRGFPVISLASMREIGGDSRFTPVITTVHRLPFSGTVQFEFYFFNLSDPRTVPVTSRMIPIGAVFYKRMGEIDPQTFRLKDLLAEQTKTRRNRVPILSPSSAPLYVVHRSLIEQFIVNNVLQGQGTKSPDALTLADLLSDPDFKSTFENTYVVVSRQTTLAQAKAAMVERPGCNDVFVTNTGAAEEPVLGLLTNVEILGNI